MRIKFHLAAVRLYGVLRHTEHRTFHLSLIGDTEDIAVFIAVSNLYMVNMIKYVIISAHHSETAVLVRDLGRRLMIFQ